MEEIATGTILDIPGWEPLSDDAWAEMPMEMQMMMADAGMAPAVEQALPDLGHTWPTPAPSCLEDIPAFSPVWMASQLPDLPSPGIIAPSPPPQISVSGSGSKTTQ